MANSGKLYLLLLLLLPLCLSQGIHQRFETYYCTQDQKGGTNEQFANRLKAYIEGPECTRTTGYCTFENPTYPIQNQKQCNGPRRNIGWIITYTFTEDFPTTLDIDWGTDFGGGSAIFVNDVFDVAYQQDFWWAFNWNSNAVFRLHYEFPAGSNKIVVYANEFCCDGPMQVQFARDGGPKKPLTSTNFNCQQTNTCEGVSCNDNEYKQGFECKACSHKCATCSSATECLTCNDPSNRTSGAPSCDCKAGMYDQDGQKNCKTCHSSCVTCSAANSCDTCTQYYHLDGICKECAVTHSNSNCGTCTSSECLTCKNNASYYLPRCTGTTCYANEYLVDKQCKPCPSTCKTCTDSSGCTTCENNEYLDSNRVCKTCTSKYGSHCGTCDNNICTSCAANASYKLPDCDSTTCPDGKWADGNFCRDCISGCRVCSDASTCTTCYDGKYKDGSNQCQNCVSPCLTCSDQSTCVSCSIANLDINTNCVDCVDGYYKSGNYCVVCGYRCATCSNSALNCDTCNDSSNRLSTPGCDCKDGYYNVVGTQQCQQCHSSCKTCSQANVCDSCDADHYLDTTCISCATAHSYNNCGTCNSNECLTCLNNPAQYLPTCTGTTCASNQYLDGKICRNCNAGCKTCLDSTGCTSCENTEYLNGNQCVSCTTQYGSHCGTCNANQCLTCLTDPSYKLPNCNNINCAAGELTDGNICRPCIAGCDTCSNQSTCDTCYDGYFKNGSNTCTACTSPCLTCTTSATNCVSCTKANFEPSSGCNQCVSGYFLTGGQCQVCGYKCATCTGSADNCSTCKDSSNRLSTPNCDCKEGKYNVINNSVCQSCDSSCKSCSNGSTCDTCETDYYLATLCVQCGTAHSYANCGTCNSNECLTCKDFPSNYLPLCTSAQCQENEYLDGKICRSCPPTCKTCLDSTGCTSCENNEFMENSECKSCATRYGSHCGSCDVFECQSCQVNSAYKLPDCDNENCPYGKFVENNHCRDCIEGCKQCNDYTTCQVCFDGYYLNGSNTCSLCTAPCLTCSSSATNCESCIKPNFDVASGCTTCLYRYFLNAQSDCASCTEFYGEQCGVCDTTQCTRCHHPNHYTLPLCTSPSCPIKQWKDNYICRDCIANCLTCNDGTTCQTCIDQYYVANDNTCQQCQTPCLLCRSLTECTLCNQRGWKPPSCDSCGLGFFMHEGECIQSCPNGFYGRYTDSTCQPCSDTCFDCETDAYFCTICPNEKFLYNGKCVDCDDVIGMEQDPDEPKGVCREICGDAKRLVPNSQHECDDGNTIDGDGCNSKCEVEEGWECYGGNIAYKDICSDKRPIGFNVEFLISNEYLNIEENVPLEVVLVFNKTFYLPDGTKLADFIVISVDGKDTSGFEIELTERDDRRLLSDNTQYDNQTSTTNGTVVNGSVVTPTPTFDIKIRMDQTVRDRDMVIDLYPKSAFSDGSGNTLADEPPPKGKVKDYFYYNEDERDNTKLFEFWMELSVLALMLFLPIYVFYYKNHFNRFYVIFMIIDSTQTLYFYRFLNIRWAINGIKFYRKLRPVIGFYMWNFYYEDLNDEEFEKYKSGVTKFDKERESALFMNNAGSILSLFFFYIFCYLVVVILSQKKLYAIGTEHKLYKFFYQARYGYFQWGVWFDSMMASCGVFIIYIFLQITNPLEDMVNTFICLFVAVFYFGFFIVVARYINKNIKELYTADRDEQIDGLTLEEKMQNNSTFKLRNVWHFVHNLQYLPQKGYFYYIFIIRKMYLSTILLIFQNHVTIQLLMCSFSHLIVIILMMKYKFFYETRETVKCIMSESLIFLAIGCMYFMLDDVSEDESYRLTFSWIVLALLLLSLFIHGVYFLYNEILGPLVRMAKSDKNEKKRVVDLRTLRKEGKLALDQDEDSSSVESSKKKPERLMSGESSNLYLAKQQEQTNNDSPMYDSDGFQQPGKGKKKKKAGTQRRLNSQQSLRANICHPNTQEDELQTSSTGNLDELGQSQSKKQRRNKYADSMKSINSEINEPSPNPDGHKSKFAASDDQHQIQQDDDFFE